MLIYMKRKNINLKNKDLVPVANYKLSQAMAVKLLKTLQEKNVIERIGNGKKKVTE